MLRITIELLPHGFEGNKRVLGIAEIENDGSGTRVRGNYKYRLWGELDIAQKKTRPWKSGRVAGFYRMSSSWKLLYRCLKAALE
jgi:hypothetical protein